jgi:hypothetical protein
MIHDIEHLGAELQLQGLMQRKIAMHGKIPLAGWESP